MKVLLLKYHSFLIPSVIISFSSHLTLFLLQWCETPVHSQVKLSAFMGSPANHCRTSCALPIKEPFTIKTLFSYILCVWIKFLWALNDHIIAKDVRYGKNTNMKRFEHDSDPKVMTQDEDCFTLEFQNRQNLIFLPWWRCLILSLWNHTRSGNRKVSSLTFWLICFEEHYSNILPLILLFWSTKLTFPQLSENSFMT